MQKRKVSSLEGKIESLWAMDDESGQSMEPIEEVPFIRLDAILTCDQKLTRLPVFAQKTDDTETDRHTENTI